MSVANSLKVSNTNKLLQRKLYESIIVSKLSNFNNNEKDINISAHACNWLAKNVPQIEKTLEKYVDR